MRPVALVAILVLEVLGAPSQARPATLSVTDCGDSGLPTQLRAVLTAAAPDDTILVPACTIILQGVADEDANAGGDLDIAKALDIQGAGRGLTIVDGNHIDRVFHVQSGATVTMSDLTIRNGGPELSGFIPADLVIAVGGGILNQGTLRLRNVELTGNTGSRGGAIFNSAGAALAADRAALGDNRVMEASAGRADGGGLYNEGTAVLRDAVIRENVAPGFSGSGGGIFNQGSLALTDATITHNAAGTGGGIFNQGGLTLANVTVNDNGGIPAAGGIFNDGTATLTNVTVSSNSGFFGPRMGFAGGIANFPNGRLTLVNVTIAGNGAAGGGAGVENQGQVSFTNTLVTNNTPQNCAGLASSASLGHNLASDGTCAFDSPTDLTSATPGLGPLADNGGATQTHALLSGSPAIDAGDNAACPATDQRGVARPHGPACDIGAYEAAPPSLGLTLNSGTFDAGDTMILTATMVPGLSASLVDVYVVVGTADARFFSLQRDGRIVPGIVPVIAGFTPVAFTGEIVHVVLGGGEPPGNYTWFAALTQAGTLSLIGSIDREPFTIAP